MESSEKLKSLVRALSLSRLQACSGLKDLRVEPCETTLPVFGHWMSLIMVAGPCLKIFFKAHYLTDEARALSRNVIGKPTAEIDGARASDFMKEYCNLTAGALKNALGEQQIDAGISLPLLTRGFDEIFSPLPDEKTSFLDRWRIVAPDSGVNCSCLIEVYDDSRLKTLDVARAQNSVKDDGEVEFL